MIKLLRVDERLVHGQVALAWTNSLNADCIFVVNDDVRKDKLRLTTLKMAVPAGVKFVSKSVDDAVEVLNSGKTDKYKMLIVVDSVADALKLAKGTELVTSVNLGNMKRLEGRRQLTSSVFATDEEIGAIPLHGSLGRVPAGPNGGERSRRNTYLGGELNLRDRV